MRLCRPKCGLKTRCWWRQNLKGAGWRDSPPHRANMLSRDVTKLGIAASYAPNTKYKVFWTLILASTDAR